MSGVSVLIGSLFTASGATVTPDTSFGNVSLLLSGTRPAAVAASGNTTFVDSSSSPLTITTTGSPGQGAFSPYSQHGWSMRFNGSNDYVVYPNNAVYQVGTGDFTLEAWVTLDLVNSTQRRVYSYQAGGNVVLYLGVTSGNKFTIDIRGVAAESSVNSTTTPTAGTWYHLAAVRSSGTLKLYVNGVSEGTPISSTHNITAATPSIGAYSTGPTDYWNGSISNLRLVKGTAVYTTNFSVPTSPLTAITNTSFLGLQSASCGDNSTNKFTPSSVVGAPRVQTFSPWEPTSPWSASANGGSGYFLSGSYINASTLSGFGTGDFTVEAWVHPDAVSAVQSIVGNFSSGSDTTWTLNLATGSSGISTPVFAGGSTTFLTSSVGLAPLVWNHIAVARSGTTLSMFLNGTRVATATNSTNFSSSNSIYVSRTPAGTNTYTGAVSDVRVITSVTTYNPSNTTITVPTSPLTAITNTKLLLNFTNAAFVDYASSGSPTAAGVSIDSSRYQFGPSSLAFAGTSGGLNLKQPLIPLNGPFTIEFWYYQASASTTPAALVTQYNSTGDAGRFTIYVGDTGAAGKVFAAGLTSSTTPSSGAWHHVAVTRDSSNIYRLWIDGALNGTSSATSTPVENTSTIIGDRGSNSIPFTGNIDDVRITKGIVRYTSTFTPPTSAFATY